MKKLLMLFLVMFLVSVSTVYASETVTGNTQMTVFNEDVGVDLSMGVKARNTAIKTDYQLKKTEETLSVPNDQLFRKILYESKITNGSFVSQRGKDVVTVGDSIPIVA